MWRVGPAEGHPQGWDEIRFVTKIEGGKVVLSNGRAIIRTVEGVRRKRCRKVGLRAVTLGHRDGGEDELFETAVLSMVGPTHNERVPLELKFHVYGSSCFETYWRGPENHNAGLFIVLACSKKCGCFDNELVSVLVPM
ncbi:hypothetical protein B0J12DRAFT_701216 [Macrophomina phaseolina]|uniref:Uncharacterized protein n=1 Tax=Macrophomina phaseolina TaxID=35725 RepID=A0ABQ8G6K3_9PEZI|nr:hypothetical protein B0J12DRAFT_701216 [Macrophomina phaseolina]